MGEAPANLRREIEQTRAQMTETIEAISERLDPRTRVKRGQQRLRETAQMVWEVTQEAVRQTTRGATTR